MPSFVSSLRRTTRALTFTAVLWLVSCWIWTIHNLHTIASSSPGTPLLIPLSTQRSLSNRIQQLDQIPGAENNVDTSGLKNGYKNLRAAATPQEALVQASTTTITAAQPNTIAINAPPPISSLIFPLHAKSGTHHAYLYIGSPPQRQTLIVDTGSRLTAFPCRPHCSDCGVHASPRFDINQSTSLSIVPCDECLLSRTEFELESYFKANGVGGNSGDGDVNVELMPSSVRGAGLRGSNHVNSRRGMLPSSCTKKQCEINQRYTEGSSWSAFEVRDNVWLGSDDRNTSNAQYFEYSKPFVFGCQVSEEGLFQSQYADGIMGLSMYTQTLVGSWHSQGAIPHESFSLCFHARGGHISLGGTASKYYEEQASSNRARHLAPMQFIPFARHNTWYFTVTVTSISVGDHVLPSDILEFLNDHKGTIVDSGTTDTFLSHKVAQAFSIAWSKVVGKKYSNKVQQYSYEQFLKLPIITFEFDGGTQWDVRPEAYMEAAAENSDQNDADSTIAQSNHAPWMGKRGFTSRIYVDEPHGAVLGANMMMDHDVYFDIANRRLGVARAKCSF